MTGANCTPGDDGMDPVTHALAGAAVAAAVGAGGARRQASGGRGDSERARTLAPVGALMGVGAIAAVLPDVDRLIASAADPLLHIEYHRHFTHALAFIPIGGAIAVLPWLARTARRPAWRAYLMTGMAAWATHGLLDASTSYGTLLYWPFSDVRAAWNMVSIIDPVFTSILLAGVLLTIVRASRAPRARVQATRPAAVAVLVCALYLAAGAWQRERASDALGVIAAGRGHGPLRAAVFPGFATNVVWRTIYEAGGTLYMDRVRVPWVGPVTWRPGPSVPALTAGQLPAHIRQDDRLRDDYRRFAWFSDGWTARDATDPRFIGDARYSREVDRYAPVWGIRFLPERTPPVEWVDFSRGRRVSIVDLWREVSGGDPAYRPLPRAH